MGGPNKGKRNLHMNLYMYPLPERGDLTEELEIENPHQIFELPDTLQKIFWTKKIFSFHFRPKERVAKLTCAQLIDSLRYFFYLCCPFPEAFEKNCFHTVGNAPTV